MFFVRLTLIFVMWVNGPSFAAVESITSGSYSGLYLVLSASLNEGNCDIEGKPYKFNSKYFKVTGQEDSLSVNVCRGEVLNDVNCQKQFSATKINNEEGKRQGYHYAARSRNTADGTIKCILHASRKRIIPAGAGFVRYERTDWMEVVTDFIDECNTNMAKTYSKSQSLSCATHIVVFGRRIQSSDE